MAHEALLRPLASLLRSLHEDLCCADVGRASDHTSVHAQAPAPNTKASSLCRSAHAVGRSGSAGHVHEQRRERHSDGAPAEFAGRRPEEVTPQEMARLMKQRAARIEETAETIGGTEDNNTGAGPTHWYENYNPKNSRPWMVPTRRTTRFRRRRRKQGPGGGGSRGAARRRRLLHRAVRRPRGLHVCTSAASRAACRAR